MVNNLFTIINEFHIVVSNLYIMVSKLFTKKKKNSIFVKCFKTRYEVK